MRGDGQGIPLFVQQDDIRGGRAPAEGLGGEPHPQGGRGNPLGQSQLVALRGVDGAALAGALDCGGAGIGREFRDGGLRQWPEGDVDDDIRLGVGGRGWRGAQAYQRHNQKTDRRPRNSHRPVVVPSVV